MNTFLSDAIEHQTRAAAAAKIAMKHLFALVDGTDVMFLGQKQSEESMSLVARINQREQRTNYGAARYCISTAEEVEQEPTPVECNHNWRQSWGGSGPIVICTACGTWEHD